MGKIGDLFVRLGLKSDGFKKGMNEAKKETKGFGAALSNMKAGALAVWGAIGAGVTKFTQDVIRSSNAMSDAWDQQMSRMKASYHSFITGLSTANPEGKSAGSLKEAWEMVKGIFNNAKAAGDSAAEMTKAFDAEFELVNSIKLQRQAVQQELNELYIMMRDTTLAPADRQAAAQKYKALLQPIADAEVRVYGDMLEAAMKAWQTGMDLDRTYSTAEMTEFFSKIGTEAEAMKAKFPDLMRVYETRKSDAENLPIFNILAAYQQAANQMSDVDKQVSRTTNSIKAEIQRSLEGIAAAVQEYGNEKLTFDLELEIDDEELDFSGLDAEIAAFAESWNAECMKIADMNNMLEQSLIRSFSNGMQALTDFVMGVEGASAEQVLAAFLQPLADTMAQMGEMFMAEGIAVAAFKNSIKNPYALIAAGAALIAVSSVVTSGLNKLTSNPGGGSSTTAGATSSDASSYSSVLESYNQEIVVTVKGEISGDKIVLAGQKTLNKWNR